VDKSVVFVFVTGFSQRLECFQNTIRIKRIFLVFSLSHIVPLCVTWPLS